MVEPEEKLFRPGLPGGRPRARGMLNILMACVSGRNYYITIDLDASCPWKDASHVLVRAAREAEEILWNDDDIDVRQYLAEV